MNGRSADSVAHGWSPVASHYIEMTLAPGETRDLVFILGYEENPEQEKFAAPDGEITSLSTRDFHIINKVHAHEVIPDGEYMEPIPVYGHLLHEPVRFLLRERYRPRNGFPGL